MDKQSNQTSLAEENGTNKAREDQNPSKKAKAKKKRKNESVFWTIFRIIVILLIIAVGVFIVLFIVAKAGKFGSISSMLYHMSNELRLMWDRIRS